ncbi:uncharacterized protein K02A2.6-like [Galendromus occidentalis]|uniref:RNA-directed DNA polymerase n=1 Tax=Galendromus occidentalis TaxID=34638 RepID=A0AAJ6W0N9_9ACAR|nr:uncharacterized protein K02A2.6-like [Galendromus occidentalis]
MKELALLSPRLQKMLLRILRYDLTLTYVPEKFLYFADTLSRFPTNANIATPELEYRLVTVHALVAMSDTRWTQLQQHTKEDPQIQHVMQYIRFGWPKADCHALTRVFWDFKEELTEEEELLYSGQRLVVPDKSRKRVIEVLHGAHQASERMIRQARLSAYWSGMTSDLRSAVDRCSQCQAYARANSKEPLHPLPATPHPWLTVALNLFHVDDVAVDYFSKDFLVRQLQTSSTQVVCWTLIDWWLIQGIPREIISDNGPPFFSEGFRAKLQEWDTVHSTISPGHSLANGLVEQTIQTLKAVIWKSKASGEDTALLSLRTTPAPDGISPAGLSTERVVRSLLPTSSEPLENPSRNTWRRRRAALRDNASKAKEYFDRHSRALEPLKSGQEVWLQTDTRQWRPATPIRTFANRAAPDKFAWKTLTSIIGYRRFLNTPVKPCGTEPGYQPSSHRETNTDADSSFYQEPET